MLLRLVYDDRLAQASYLIGCQRTGEALVVDPERDVDRYIELAGAHGLRIVAAAETHIHADFLSGVRELAERIGAHAYVSGEGGDEWNPRWLDQKVGGGSYAHTLLRDGDEFMVGRIRVRAVHTPGHTPEHLMYEVTDEGGGADAPMGVATGDFVFVGDLGRPDLLETAAGQQGVKEGFARRLYASARRFIELPDHLQVWPGHGAGSACGKALGAVPQSTVGYEKRFNAALAEAEDEGRFVREILEGQPEPPAYFARMKQQNRDGVAVLGEVPRPRRMSGEEVASRAEDAGVVVLDARPWEAFRDGHLPGSLWAPPGPTLHTAIGSWLDPAMRIVLVAPQGEVEELVRALVRIGHDHWEGWAPPEVLEAAPLRERLAQAAEAPMEDAEGLDAVVLDLRGSAERAGGAVAGSLHIPHTQLASRLDEVPRDRAVAVHCARGVRSGAATALLEREGVRVINLAGGYERLRELGTVGRAP